MAVEKGLKEDGPSFIVAKVDQVDLREAKVFREDRGPGQDTRENKYSFVRHIERLENKTILKRGAS